MGPAKQVQHALAQGNVSLRSFQGGTPSASQGATRPYDNNYPSNDGGPLWSPELSPLESRTFATFKKAFFGLTY